MKDHMLHHCIYTKYQTRQIYWGGVMVNKNREKGDTEPVNDYGFFFEGLIK